MRILDRLPLTLQAEIVALPTAQFATVKPLYAVVRVSLRIKDRVVGPIPALLDAGHNHNFSISRSQLLDWLGIDASTMPPSGRVRLRGEDVVLREADVLLHRNARGTTDLRSGPPFALKVDADRGIAVHDQALAALPILGIRPLVRNGLKLVFDGKRKDVTLSTAWW